MNTVSQLAVTIQQGRDDLIPQMWEAIRGLVGWYAKRFYIQREDLCKRRSVDLDDLIQSGFFALADALRKYDPELGAEFTTFFAYDIFRYFHEAIGRTRRQAEDLLNYALSLDAPISDDDPDGSTLYDKVVDSEALSFTEDVDQKIYLSRLREELEKLLSALPAVESEVLREEFFNGSSLTEIAEARSETYNEVRNIEAKALRHIRADRKRLIQLEKYIDQDTPFYLHVSTNRFNATHTSAVEQLTITRDRIRKQYLHASYSYR